MTETDSLVLQYLEDCAQAFQVGNWKEAENRIRSIRYIATFEKDRRRSNLYKYFAEALVRRAYGIRPSIPYSDIAEQRFICNRILSTAIFGKKRAHVIDFFIMTGVPGDWGYLLHRPFFEAIGSGSDTQSIRFSLIVPPFIKKDVDAKLEAFSQYLACRAKACNVEFEFVVVKANCLDDVQESVLEFRKSEDEALVVIYTYKLHRLLADPSGAMERELVKLRQIKPDFLIIVEQNANQNDPNFSKRLKDTFQLHCRHLSIIWENSLFQDLCRRLIYSRVGCEGMIEMEGHKTMTQFWKSRLQRAGFLPVQLELDPWSKADSFVLPDEFGSLVSRGDKWPPVVLSAWEFSNPLDHFDPANSKSTQGVTSREATQSISPLTMPFSSATVGGDLLDISNMPQATIPMKSYSQAPAIEFVTEDDFLEEFLQIPLPMRSFQSTLNIKRSLNTAEPRDGDKVGTNEQGFSKKNAISHEPNVDIDHEMVVKANGDISTLPRTKKRKSSSKLLKGASRKNVFSEPNLGNDLEMVKANGDISTLPPARKGRSEVWDHFSKFEENGVERAQCNYCNNDYPGSSKSGTTHLKNHWVRCVKKKSGIHNMQLNSVAQNIDLPSQGAKEGNPIFDQKRSSLDLVKVIIENPSVLDAVQREPFKTLFKNLQPSFEVPPQEVILSDIYSIYLEKKEKLRQYLDQLACNLNLMIGWWKDNLREDGYCYLIAHFIDDDWKLKKTILAFKTLESRNDIQTLSEMITSSVLDWKMSNKVCSVTVDNLPLDGAIVQQIKGSYLGGKVFLPSEGCYINSSLVQDALKEIDFNKTPLGKFQNLVDQAPTPNMYFGQLCEMCKKFPLLDCSNYPSLESLKTKFDDYWHNCSWVFAIAAILDPHLKFQCVGSSFLEIYGNNDKLQMFRRVLEDVYYQYANECKNPTCNVNEVVSWQRELDRYLMKDLLSYNTGEEPFDILGWWGENGEDFPTLSRMARDILAIPTNAFLPDSILRTAIKSQNNSGMKPEIVEALICIQDWLELEYTPNNKDNDANMENVATGKMVEQGNCRVENCEQSKSTAEETHSQAKLKLDKNRNSSYKRIKAEQTTWSEQDIQAYLVSHLTEDDEEIWTRCKGSGDLTVTCKTINVDAKHLAPLLNLPRDNEYGPEYYIDALVVDAFSGLLQKRTESFPNLNVKHHSFESGTAVSLTKWAAEQKTGSTNKKKEPLDWVKKKKNKLKHAEKLFLPVCLENHWMLFCVDTKKQELSWLDSLMRPSEMYKDEKEAISCWFKESLLTKVLNYKNAKEWDFRVRTDIPQQENGVDCALFVMKYADCSARK